MFAESDEGKLYADGLDEFYANYYPRVCGHSFIIVQIH